MWIELVAAAALAGVTALLHGAGLIAIRSLFGLSDRKLESRAFGLDSLVLMASTILALFLLHLVEIWLFAGFYKAVGATGSIETAVTSSIGAYATLGKPTELAAAWRVTGGAEGLVGYLMIGWSTAFLVLKFRKMKS